MQTAATALRTISESAPFYPFVHTTGKGGMRLEPDRFHTWDLAVPGGVYRAGSSRGVFAASGRQARLPGACLCGMAAGIMLAASVWSLLLPAIARSQGRTLPVGLPPAAGAYFRRCGAFAAGGCRRAAAGAAGPGHCGRMVLAVTLHNLPEGMVVGLAAALALHGDAGCRQRRAGAEPGHRLAEYPGGCGGQSAADPERAYPAGSPLPPGRPPGWWSRLGAVLAFVLAEWVGAALPWLMSAAAGCMVCVTAQEMIPEAVEPDEVAGVISIVLGFALMMALDVAL